MDCDAWIAEGDALAELGDLEGAVQRYDNAVACDPRDVEAHTSRAVALQQLGRLQEAFESFSAAIECDPDDTDLPCYREDVMCRLDPDSRVAIAIKAIAAEDIQWMGGPLPLPSALGVAQEHCDVCTPERFAAEYAGKLPVVIGGLMDLWPAMKNWQLANMRQDHSLSAVKVGTTMDLGNEVMLPLGVFLDHLTTARDRSHLYVFEPNMRERLPLLLNDFSAFPGYFDDDVLDMYSSHWEHVEEADDERIAPWHQWFLVGGAGSGSGPHLDPNHTSAWNACVVGCKRWAYVAPGCAASELEIRGVDQLSSPDMPAATWWQEVLPRLLKKYPESVHEFSQPAGSLVYLPPTIWHAVLNIEDSVAVTQNYVARREFRAVLSNVRKENGAAGCPNSIAAEVGRQFDFTPRAKDEIVTIETKAWIKRVESSDNTLNQLLH